MKGDNISQLGDYDVPYCQQYTHKSCYISLFKFKSFDQFSTPQTASNFRHLLSCGTKVLHAIRRLFANFRKVEMDEISFVWLPWQPANKQVLSADFLSFGLKATSFLNTRENYKCKVSIVKWYPIHAQCEKLIFIEVGGPNFGGTGGKIGLKMENAPNSRIFRDNISSSPWNIRTCLVTYFWHITSNYSFRNHKKNSKPHFLHNFPSIPPTFHLSLF